MFIKRYLVYAGSAHDIFSDNAIDKVFRFYSGAARLINKVCTHSLSTGQRTAAGNIDDHMVKLVVQENCLKSPCHFRMNSWTSILSTFGHLILAISGHYVLAVTTNSRLLSGGIVILAKASNKGVFRGTYIHYSFRHGQKEPASG